MMNKPWDRKSWGGDFNEGDMLEELVEHDSVRYGVPVEEAREQLNQYELEELRVAWWYAIGRHMEDTTDVS